MVWQTLSTENSTLYSQIGLKLVDEFTGLPPQYPIDADLEYQNAPGTWEPVATTPVVTPSGVISYPALGRSVQAAVQPALSYRVLLRSDFYRSEYLRHSDGLEFDIHPYDDSTPPAVIPDHPQVALMLPNTKYAYPSHVRVVNGLVHDVNGNPVANVEISEGIRERVLTDERGAFSLPLRWPVWNAVILLDALDHRTGRSDNITVNLPGDLSQGHLFTIT